MFTIDDMEQIAFFQLIYILLLIYLTLREINRKPKSILLWLIVGVDVLYTAMLTYLAYLVSTYAAKSSTAHFRWNTLLLSILLPALLLLIAFTIYNVRRDKIYKKYKDTEVKQG